MNVTTPMPCAIFAYVHHNRRVAALVTLRCQTDFALRTDVLQELGQQLAVQAAAIGHLDGTSVWLRDTALTVRDIIALATTKLGEPVHIDTLQVQGS